MIIDFSKNGNKLPEVFEGWQKEIIDFIHEYQNNNSIEVQTSGSTGTPKKYYLEKNAMQQSANLTAKFLGLNQGDVALLCMPVQYIAGKMMIVRAIEIGMKLVCIKPKVQLNIPSNIDFGAMTPMQAEASLDQLFKIRKIILGGAKVSNILEKKLKLIDSTIYETYGMTETITHIAMRKLNEEKYFHTLPSIQITTSHSDCLEIQTPYFEEKIITNDIVSIKDANSFELLGRVDHVINSGGVKVNPEKLEALLKPYISQPFIIHYVADEVLGQKLVLVIEGSKSEVHYPHDLLPKNLNPKKIFFVRQLPRTLSGKIKRKEVVLL